MPSSMSLPACRECGAVAIDCEMVGVAGEGTVDNALCRVSLVSVTSHGFETLLDTWVKVDREIVDYRTAITGIDEDSLAIKRSIPFQEARSIVQRLIADRILVGHALENDFTVLGISHPSHLVRDTATQTSLLPPGRRTAPSLRLLAKYWLNEEMHIGAHDSVQDATTALRLYMLHSAEWEMCAWFAPFDDGMWMPWPAKKHDSLEEASGPLSQLDAKPYANGHMIVAKWGCSKPEREILRLHDPAPAFPPGDWSAWKPPAATESGESNKAEVSAERSCETKAPDGTCNHVSAFLRNAAPYDLAELRVLACDVHVMQGQEREIVEFGADFCDFASSCSPSPPSSLPLVHSMLLGISGICLVLAVLSACQSSRQRAELAFRSVAFELMGCTLRAAFVFRSGWFIIGGPLGEDLRSKLNFLMVAGR